MFLSHTRPLVKSYNPYIESFFFKTVKCHASYPGRFATLEVTREWLGEFIHWYNTVDCTAPFCQDCFSTSLS